MVPIKTEDLLSFKFLSDIRSAPDGAHAVFVQHQSSPSQDGYDSFLWMMDTQDLRCRQLTFCGQERVFTWLDQETILFVRSEGGGSCLYSIRLGGGEPVPLEIPPIPYPILSMEPANAGRLLVMARTDFTAGEDRAENGADWFIIDELPFSANGKNYVGRQRNRLFFLNLADGALDPITPPFFQTDFYTFCKEENKLVVCGQEYRDVRKVMSGIYFYNLEADTVTELLRPGVMQISHVDFLASRVLFTATDAKAYNLSQNNDFYTIDPAAGEITLLHLSAYQPVDNSIGSDCRYGGGTLCQVHNGAIYYVATVMENAPLYRLIPGQDPEQISSLPGSTDCFTIAGDTVFLIGMKGQRLQEIYALPLSGGEERRVTGINEAYYQDHPVREPQPCGFNTNAGDLVQGFVLYPAGYHSGKKYPAILDIHGGPRTAYGTVYYHEMQYWADQGYFVFFCNPRGSDGRGNEFGFLIGHYGTVDYEDIMRFTDVVLERFPQIDPARVGVTGGSYGGYMTNWLIGHTDRFAAAATQRSVVDWVTDQGVGDGGYYFAACMYPPTPWENFETAWEQSPIKYAKNVRTPLLMIHSDHDFRCHLAGALEFYTAVINNGTDVRMCLFKDENHELSRSGRPFNRIRRLDEITAWFDRHLKAVEPDDAVKGVTSCEKD